ncbi:hypothetical protein ACSVDM_12160 [Nocardia sp. JW2]|uniref:hypothetical protein n=1 Tax=Nocardia sp. JW2 TaxID=3450738 RepID=UPI003F43BF58
MIESLERGRGNSAAELDARGRLATSLVIASSRHEAVEEKMEQAERAAPTRPHPNTPSGSVVQKTAGLAAAVLDKVRDAVTGRKDDQPPRPPRP